MQKCVNLVDLEKCCKMRLYAPVGWEKTASLSPPKKIFWQERQQEESVDSGGESKACGIRVIGAGHRGSVVLANLPGMWVGLGG